jgi:hypothetical protein
MWRWLLALPFRAADRLVSRWSRLSPTASSPSRPVGAMLYGAYAVLSARALLNDVFCPDLAASKTLF